MKNGDHKIKGNALIDEGSTKTYIIADAVGEVGIQGTPRRVTVNILNNQTETFETTSVEVELESVDRSVIKAVNVFAAEKGTEYLETIDWKMYGNKWPHLRGIQFPDSEPHPLVDMYVLIGIGQVDLHHTFKGVKGRPGESVARLTPFSWTWVGPVGSQKSGSLPTKFTSIYFAREHREELNEVSGLLQRF